MTRLSQEEALDLALHCSEQELFASATRLREAAFGKRVELCAIINARSGNCSMDCRFCSQSRHNPTHVAVFPLLDKAVLRERLAMLADQPVRHVGIVTSGGALAGEEFERLRELVAACPPVLRAKVCASLGRLSLTQLEQLREAGLTRFHHNLETDEAYYPQVCTTQRWQDRLATTRNVRAAGLALCSGGLFGMGETWTDRINFALRLREEGAENVPLNFLYPHPHTPLGGQAPLPASEALRIIAVFRHILPQATLRVCGGRPLVLGSRQHELFAAGANALMTGDYLTTQGEGLAQDIAMIEACGLELVQ
ncbi:MAG: biotin synthase BioB [Desulfovibrionaceae bacterium]|nr:biotin synthase BioB [Desulfovibrionaceae bacterium]